MKKLIVLIITFLFPLFAFAFMTPFGGQIEVFLPCDRAIFVQVGSPRPAELIWLPGVTTTYLQSFPYRAGQWLLGLYYDVVPAACTRSNGGVLEVLHGFPIHIMGSSY